MKINSGTQTHITDRLAPDECCARLRTECVECAVMTATQCESITNVYAYTHNQSVIIMIDRRDSEFTIYVAQTAAYQPSCCHWKR